MALLPSIKTKISVEATQYRASVSEFLIQTIGRSLNYLIDRMDTIAGQQASHVIPAFLTANQSYAVPAGYLFTGFQNLLVNLGNDPDGNPRTDNQWRQVTVSGPGTVVADGNTYVIYGVAVRNATLGS